MSEAGTIAERIGALTERMRSSYGVGGADLAQVLRRAGRHLPRRLRREAALLARAEPLAAHPRLRCTLDAAALERAEQALQAHLGGIDPADRRKGWWLGVLGGLAFNLLLFAALLIAFLVWRGVI
jgi:hypothetical protein